MHAALRLARAGTGRDKIIKFEGHYHGWTNNILVSYKPKSGTPFDTQPSFGGQPAHEYADVIVLPWNDRAALEQAFEQHPSQIAAVITEPILTNNGSCLPDDGYLQFVIELCARHGAVSIFDEVITGFRLALDGAREYFGVQPDLSVCAKAMGGGFTIAAVGGRRAMFDVLRDGRTIHRGTYNGNPINIAAAIATIQTLRRPGVYERIHRHGQALRDALEQNARACGQTLIAPGFGAAFHALFGLSTPPRNYRDTLKADAATYARFRLAMLERGVHLMPDTRWYVGASHTNCELAKVIPAIESAMKEISS